MPVKLKHKLIGSKNHSKHHPVQLEHTSVEHTSALLEDADGLTAPHDITLGLLINKTIMSAMVKTYRDNHAVDPNCLKFIHFNLQEVTQLFIDNGALNMTDTLASQFDNLQYYGFKIYMGNHYDISTCPNPTQIPNPYLNMDTAIICNTKLNAKTQTWEAMLADDTNSISIAGAGDGLDRGAICPPNCPTIPPSVDADGYYQQDILSTP